MSIECNIVDAGARYGLHPTWQSLADIATFHLYELDIEEVRRLEKKYTGKKNIHLNHLALFSSETEVTVNSFNHKALNSIYKPNTEFLHTQNYLQDEYIETENYVVKAKPLDEIFPENNVHFLKLDTEGSELEVLKGSLNLLQNSILGIRSEVFFAHLLKGGTNFAEINEFLLNSNFELINFDYDGRGVAKSPYTQVNKYGKLRSTDAVWILNETQIFEIERKELAQDIIRLSIFLILNNASDIALSFLLTSVDKHKINFSQYFDDPLFLFLYRKVALLFKEISYLPSINSDELGEIFYKIFNREFPTLNSFNESDLINN